MLLGGARGFGEHQKGTIRSGGGLSDSSLVEVPVGGVSTDVIPWLEHLRAADRPQRSWRAQGALFNKPVFCLVLAICNFVLRPTLMIDAVLNG